MKKNIQLLYNPKAGDTLFKMKLDNFLRVFIDKGYEVRIYRSEGFGKMTAYLNETDLSNTEAVIVAGGDGTINEVVNALMRLDNKPALGVIPAGTCNDFAKSLGFDLDLDSCIEIIGQMNIQPVDVGEVNGHYFINVCGAGLFTNISQNVNVDLKNTFGKIAYYVKGAEQLPAFRPFHLKIESDGKEYEDDFVLFLVLNSEGAGGIQLATGADLSDGYYDFVGIKSVPINDFTRMLLKLLKREHLADKAVLHLRSDNFKISSNNISDSFKESDVDGESGPQLPLDIQIHKSALRLIVNKSDVE